jgi:hypothetical protein
LNAECSMMNGETALQFNIHNSPFNIEAIWD